MIGRWLVLNVGCLECHQATSIAGTYDTYEAAVAAAGDDAELLTEVDDWSGIAIQLICDLEGTRHG